MSGIHLKNHSLYDEILQVTSRCHESGASSHSSLLLFISMFCHFKKSKRKHIPSPTQAYVEEAMSAGSRAFPKTL